MKEIILLQEEESVTGINPETKMSETRNIVMSTRELISVALDTPPKEGFKLQDYRKRDRIAEALETASGGTLKLEDNDYTTLKELVNFVRWSRRSKFLKDFLESFE